MNYSSSFSKFFSRSSCISCSSNFSSMFVKKVFAGVGLANIIGSMQVAAIPGGCKDFLCHLCMCCFWNFLRIVENNNFNSTNRSEQFSYTEEESGWKKTNLSQACEVDRNFKNSEEVELKGKDGYVNLYKLFSELRFGKSNFSSCKAFLEKFVDFLDENKNNIRLAENLKNTSMSDGDFVKSLNQFKAMCKSEKLWENGKYFFEGLKLFDIKIKGLKDFEKIIAALEMLRKELSSENVYIVDALCANDNC